MAISPDYLVSYLFYSKASALKRFLSKYGFQLYTGKEWLLSLNMLLTKHKLIFISLVHLLSFFPRRKSFLFDLPTSRPPIPSPRTPLTDFLFLTSSPVVVLVFFSSSLKLLSDSIVFLSLLLCFLLFLFLLGFPGARGSRYGSLTYQLLGELKSRFFFFLKIKLTPKKLPSTLILK